MKRSSQLEIVAPNASPEEAAAIVAALEQFMRQTAPPPAAGGPAISEWQRASLHEGVGRESVEPGSWGDPHPWTP